LPDLKLEFTGYEYWDRSLELIRGAIKPKGVELTYNPAPRDLFERQVKDAAFPASEMSTSFTTKMHSANDRRLWALPLFTARDFFHSRIFVRSDAGIKNPEDLKGKRIGFPDYQMTAAVWIRGLIHHEFGVTARDAQWFQGGFEQPGYVQRAAMDLPPDISVTTIPQDKSMMGMLLAGEIDAVASPTKPKAFLEGNPKVRRLFPDYREVEKAYYKKTKLFPASHIVVLRNDVYEQNPWVVKAMIEAWTEARDAGWKAIQNVRILSLPWLNQDLEELAEVFGGEHPYPYGFKGALVTVEALTQYLHEQGITKRRVDPKEIFPKEALDT
jgi:4,5-dihydroxyphthalate decarboxylase